MTRNILIIEDDPSIARLVHLHLTDAGYRVEVAGDGRSGLERAEQIAFDLLILDVMLPRMDGLEVCRRIRERPGYVPILMLTARSTEGNRVAGLDLGADDYLTKPFSIRELVARANALVRRSEALAAPSAAPSDEVIEAGDLRIDTGRRSVSIAGRPVNLTAREFDLLTHFARHPGRVFTRIQLLDQVWGYTYEGYEHTVNSHINRLRAKIERDPAQPEYVLTVWGVGYRFMDAGAG
jgi:DNA-binding response OmpR family regulator